MRLFTLLEQIREQQQNQTTLLTTIRSKLGEGCDDPMPEDISFPITNEQEMSNFEEKMKDKYIQKVVVSCLIKGHLEGVVKENKSGVGISRHSYGFNSGLYAPFIAFPDVV